MSSDHPVPKPPVAKVVPTVSAVHGERRVDDYHWLREKESPEVRAYLEAENAYADAVMKPTEALPGGALRGDARPDPGDRPACPTGRAAAATTPAREKGKQYPIYCRKEGQPRGAPEEVMLDLNALAEGKTFLALGAYHGERRRRACSRTRPTTPASGSTRCA